MASLFFFFENIEIDKHWLSGCYSYYSTDQWSPVIAMQANDDDIFCLHKQEYVNL